MPLENLPDILATQNCSFGLTSEEAGKVLVPIFKVGPSDRDTICWECEVSPDIRKKCFAKKILYERMHACKVREHIDYIQCTTCLKYGHREDKCTSAKPTCSFCGVLDHKKSGCNRATNKEKPCFANCKAEHEATDFRCKVRRRAIDQAIRRRDYGTDGE